MKKPAKDKRHDYQVHTFQIPLERFLPWLQWTVQKSLQDYKKCIMHFSDETLEFTEL